MGLFSAAKLFGMTIRESATDGSDFTNPDADYRRLFLGEDGNLHLKDSAGTVTDIGGGSGGTPTFVGAKAYSSATQSIPNATLTAVTFGSEEFDSNAFHDTSSNTSRMTVPTGKAGKYLLVGGAYWSDSNADAELLFRLNGTTNVRGAACNPQGIYRQNVIAMVNLAEGDYVELMAYQGSGGSKNIGHASAATAQSHLSISLLGV